METPHRALKRHYYKSLPTGDCNGAPKSLSLEITRFWNPQTAYSDGLLWLLCTCSQRPCSADTQAHTSPSHLYFPLLSLRNRHQTVLFFPNKLIFFPLFASNFFFNSTFPILWAQDPLQKFHLCGFPCKALLHFTFS